MAEYIKFRLNAAKVGVSMALLALIGGLAERAQASGTPPQASKSSVGGFLKLTGLSKTISSDFLKLEDKYLKLNNAIGAFESKLLKYERSVASQYYKSKVIDASFLKIDAANAEFLKIDNANAEFLKITDANSQFLKITDAQNKFVAGRGGVMTGAASITDGTSQVLMGDGSVRVLVGLIKADTGALVPAVQLENDTNASINFTFNGDGRLAPGALTTLGPHGSAQDTVALLPAVQQPGSAGGQLNIQLFGGGGGAGKVWTVTVSTVPGGAGGDSFVGQMLIGLL